MSKQCFDTVLSTSYNQDDHANNVNTSIQIRENELVYTGNIHHHLFGETKNEKIIPL